MPGYTIVSQQFSIPGHVGCFPFGGVNEGLQGRSSGCPDTGLCDCEERMVDGDLGQTSRCGNKRNTATDRDRDFSGEWEREMALWDLAVICGHSHS